MNNTTLLPLRNGGHTIINSDLYPMLCNYSWRTQENGYAACNFKVGNQSNWIYLHRLINCTPIGTCTDHINGNRLDNRRENLRNANNLCNRRNTKKHQRGNPHSQYKGVWKSNTGRWVSQIGVNKKRIHLGTFSTEEQAAEAYNKAAIEHFGEFARTNAIWPQTPKV